MGNPQPYPYTHNTVDNKSTLLPIISGDSSIYSLHLELRLWVDIEVIKHSGQGATLQK